MLCEIVKQHATVLFFYNEGLFSWSIFFSTISFFVNIVPLDCHHYFLSVVYFIYYDKALITTHSITEVFILNR